MIRRFKIVAALGVLTAAAAGAEEPKPHLTLQGLWSSASAITWSGDGKWVAAGDVKGVRVWDAATGKERIAIPQAEPVRSLALDREGTIAVVRRGKLERTESTVAVLDLATGKDKYVLDPADPKAVRVGRVAYHPGGNLVATARERGKDYAVELWNAGTGKLVRSFDGRTEKDESVLKNRIGKRPWSLSFSTDGKFLAATSALEDTVRVWDVATGKERPPLKGATSSGDVRFSTDGKQVFVTEPGDLWSIPSDSQAWDSASGELLETIKSGVREPYSCFSGDAKRVLLEARDDKGQEFILRDRKTKATKAIKTLPKVVDYVSDFSPDSRYVVLTERTAYRMSLYDVESGREVFTAVGLGEKGAGDPVHAFSPDGAFVATTGVDVFSTVRVWKLPLAKKSEK